MTMQTPLQAVYMRGGASKGVLCRPDPYRQQIDGMVGGTSSTTKVVIEEQFIAEAHMSQGFGGVDLAEDNIMCSHKERRS